MWLPSRQRSRKIRAYRADWLRHGGTWFAGVNILANDAQGRVEQGPELGGAVWTVSPRCMGQCPGPRSNFGHLSGLSGF